MRRSSAALTCLMLSTLAVPVRAAEPREGSGFLDRLSISEPRLRPAPVIEPIGAAGAALAPGVSEGWTAFQHESGGGDWQGYVDRRNGLLEAAEGSGIPWIPGPGNQLTRQDVAAHLTGAEVDLAALEKIARAFLPRVAPLLGVSPRELVLNPKRSQKAGDQVWFVDFDLKRGGRTVEGARVVFRVSHGNLIQLGSENLPSAGETAPAESVRREEALATLAAHVRGFNAADTFLDGGSLHLLPAALEDSRFTEGFEAGRGRGLALVWQFVFRRRGETGTWRARVDASSGKLLELVDTNRYAGSHGGVYPSTYLGGGETVLPMPFLNISSSLIPTDGSGRYTYNGFQGEATLDGPYVDISDTCGPIGLIATGSGRLAFGTSGGTDCDTPGKGGGGNTHAARTEFYHVNRIMEAARAWLPGNDWLESPLETNVNLPYTCNAYWTGDSINFFKSGDGCGNTGEIAGISLHEFGHGLDDFDGGGSSDNGSGEAYGDLTAALMLRDSCIGPGFSTSNCGGFGDPCTSCTGVRDIDWAKHASQTPHTVANFTQLRCGSGYWYGGPCGGQGHCESQVITEAVWDFAARDLPGAGGNAAWAVAERLWYLSRPTATAAFTCNTATTPWTSNGCSAGSLWRTMRAIDDDDGNLANGTPHSCQLFAAFNRHGIACATDPGANVCHSACTPPAAPALSATAGQEQVQLSWTGGSGLVYDLYESELGCSSGWRKVANDFSGTSITDVVVFPGRPHSYQVVAHPAGKEACSSAPSACRSATPTAPPCTPPAPVTEVTATALGVDRIELSWRAYAGASDYEILRGTSAAGPFTVVGTVSYPTGIFIDTNLAMGTTYFYVVRALFDDCASGNSAVVSATTGRCVTQSLYFNDFETGGGLSDWTPALGASENWRGIQSCPASSGSKIFRFGGLGCTDPYTATYGTLVAVTPGGPAGIQIPVGAVSNRLSFRHRWDFELGWDGAWLTLSVNGSAFTYVPATAVSGGTGYSGDGWFSGTQPQFVSTEFNLDTACDIVTGGKDGCEGKTVRIAFTAATDNVIYWTGWFLDDVTVTSCVLQGCTGAPAIGTATPIGNNQIQLSWSNGAPASSKFNVYRALGTCAQPGPFEKLAGGLSGSPFLDTDVSGQLSWAYKVSGFDASGLCESDLSGCVAAVAAGPCTLPPDFAGLAAAANAGTATCGVDLTWAAATSRCGNGVTYDVFRSTVPGFTPGPENWIASGVTGTSWNDDDALSDRTTYHYAVRAVDSGNGRAESNAVKRSAETTGEIVPLDLLETFEAAGGFDHPGWEHRALSGPTDWKWSTIWSRSGTHSWLAPSFSGTSSRELVSPRFRAAEGTALSFWHTFELDGCYDGGTLEITADDGASWSVLPDNAFTAGGFNGTIYSSSNPLYGKRAWCEGTAGPLTQVQADLSDWEGQDVRLRWHAGDDDYVRHLGWWIDDVALAGAEKILTCQPSPPPSAALDFYSVAPCRLLDTRVASGPLPAQSLRGFAAAGSCGIPSSARALVVNVTVVQPAGPGFVTLFPTGTAAPPTSTINFTANQLRSNIAVVPLGSGTGALGVRNGSGGTVHLIVDVTGYFE